MGVLYIIEFLAVLYIANHVIGRKQDLYRFVDSVKKSDEKEKLEKVLKRVDSVLARSGVRRRLPFLNARKYIMVHIAVFVIAFLMFRSMGYFVALIYGLAITYIPYVVLLVITSINTRRMRKSYLNFLSVFKGFYIVEDNIVNSLETTAQYVGEPLCSIIKTNVNMYKRSIMGINECMDNIINEVGDREYKKFFKFLKIHSKYGGNLRKSLDKFHEQGEKLASMEASRGASAVAGTLVIVLMLVVSSLLIHEAIKDPDIVYIVKNTVTGQMVAVSNAVAIAFALYMISVINRE